RDLILGQSAGVGQGRESSSMENLVRVYVPDPAEETRIGEGALKGMVLRDEPLLEVGQVGFEHVQSAAFEFAKPVGTSNQMDRRPALGSGFGQMQRAVGKLESRQGE